MNNNIMTIKPGFMTGKMNKEAMKNGGKYGCAVLGLYLLHDLCVRAMDKNFAFKVSLDPKGKIDFSVTPPTVSPK